MKRKPCLKSERGSVLAQVIIAAALALIVVLTLAEMTSMMNKQINYAQTKMSLFEIRNNLLATIVSDVAWKNTIQYVGNQTDPKLTACLTGTNGTVPPPYDCSGLKVPLNIVDASNSVILKASVPTSGMTRTGTACNNFDATHGNTLCPIHVEAQWETDCVSPCNMLTPPLKISVLFQYNDPNATTPINTKLLNFVLRR